MQLRNKMIYVVLLLATLLSLSRLFAATVSPGQSIQDAINNASPGDTIDVPFGNYTGRIVIGKNRSGSTLNNLILQGAGAGVTFLNISGTRGTAITFDNVSGSTVRGFTIKNADIGVKAVNSKANIANNIFIRNKSAFENSSSYSRVINNTFYRNTRAVFTNSSSTLKNNIIAGSDRYGVVGSRAGSITYNLFYNNVLGNFSGIATPSDSNNVADDPDPLFVNYTSDFHLRLDSPAIDSGDPEIPDALDGGSTNSDIGAYGGPDADVIPSTVTGVTAVSAKDKVTISWNRNLAYNIFDYKISYKTSSGSINDFVFVGDIAGDVDTVDLTAANTLIQPNQKFFFNVRAVDENANESRESAIVTGAIDTLPPTTPANLAANIGEKRLFLSWSAATDGESGVKGYKVHYGTVSGSYSNSIDVGGILRYELSGLTNGITYYIAVSAYDFAGNEGAMSAEASGTPEEIRGITGLKEGGGCFIATAAYGSYEERHVKVLREFRDRYLLTNIPGRAFVSLYYRTSPPIADFIRNSEILKAIVRVALLPLIALAWMLINHPIITLTGGGLIMFFFMRGLKTLSRERIQSVGRNTATAMSKIFILSLFIVLFNSSTSLGNDRNGLSFGMTYGQLEPASDEWKEIYDDDRVSTFRLSLGYRFHPTISAEIGAGYLTKDGKGKTITGTATGVKTTFQEAPVDLTLIYRLNYFDEQIIVPYIGGGVSYNFYWEKVKDGDELKGGVWGYHATGGLQLLLDYIDRRSSIDLEEDYGVENTYLTIGATHSVIDDFGDEDVDLGGWNYNAGLLFEF